jgi:alkylation response protein AidB-like acyl-CoA dehydrogenase
VAYACEREQFGRPIARFQLVQAMLVEMATATEAGRLLAYRAAGLVGSGKRAVAESSMAKAYCTEMAVRVASLGVQVHGAAGLASGGAPERILRDARMLTIPDGTTQIQTLIIGRELTGHSALV